MKLVKLLAVTMALLLCMIVNYSKGQVGTNGVFLKGIGGASVMTANSIGQERVASENALGEAQYKIGWMGGLAMGYRLNHWAGELAWDYQNNEHDQVSFSDGSVFSGGSYSSRILFLNGYYFYNPVGASDMEPYAGVGVGWVENIEIDLKNKFVEKSFTGGDFLALQFIIGIMYPLNDNWALNGQVRIQRVKDIDFEQNDGDAILNNVDYDPFSLMMGISYKF